MCNNLKRINFQAIQNRAILQINDKNIASEILWNSQKKTCKKIKMKFLKNTLFLELNTTNLHYYWNWNYKIQKHSFPILYLNKYM